ncbi:hypothetical protein KC335_g4 [Hortaea werneckii]|nr:hypothetical protein KC335_g4 [Hortaea werneckii]
MEALHVGFLDLGYWNVTTWLACLAFLTVPGSGERLTATKMVLLQDPAEQVFSGVSVFANKNTFDGCKQSLNTLRRATLRLRRRHIYQHWMYIDPLSGDSFAVLSRLIMNCLFPTIQILLNRAYHLIPQLRRLREPRLEIFLDLLELLAVPFQRS